MRLSWGLRWLLLLTVLAAIGAAATLGIGHYRYGTDRARKTEFRLTDVQATAYAANAAEWRMIARRRGDVVDTHAFAESMVAVRAKLEELADSDAAAMPVKQQILPLLARYEQAVAVELDALRNGDVSTSVSVDVRRVDPTFDQINSILSRAIATTEERRAAAERHAILAARLIVL